MKALGELRLWPELELGRLGGTCWLRGGVLTSELHTALRKVSGLVDWEVKGERLCRWGNLIPEAILPRLTWSPLKDSFSFTMPESAGSGMNFAGTRLELIRSAEEKKANLLITSWESWTAWAITAPEIRLKALKFAVEAHGQALIWGEPLPTLSGIFYTETDGIAVPCGWQWQPALPAIALRHWLDLSPGDLALLEPDGQQRVIFAEQIIPATRANVRSTAAQNVA